MLSAQCVMSNSALRAVGGLSRHVARCALRWFALGLVSQARLVAYALCQTPESPYAARSAGTLGLSINA